MSKKDLLLQWIATHKKPFIQLSQDLWAHPELSLEEHYAAEQLAALLQNQGFTVTPGAASMPTAFTAVWGSGTPVLGFSSEYDALPGLSQNKDKSNHTPITVGGPGHGCGHNLLAVGGIMAACALKQVMEENQLPGTIKIFGTPAEELCIGKPFMAKNGYFKDVDVFLDWHPSHMNRGAACDTNAYFNVKYHFRGKTAHGNAPWNGRSALDTAMLTAHAIELLREHIKPGSEDAPTTLNYAFPDVGSSFPNVVPDYSVLWCVGRMKNAALAADVLKRVNQCAAGCALASETIVQTEVITATHDFIPNLHLAHLVDQNLNYTGLPVFSEKDQETAMAVQKEMDVTPTGFSQRIEPVALGSQPVTDSSEYSWFAPVAFLNLALTPSEDTGWHNWAVTKFSNSEIGQKVLESAGKVLACTAYDLLTNPTVLQAAREEWKKRLDGRSYQSLLPDDAVPVRDFGQ